MEHLKRETDSVPAAVQPRRVWVVAGLVLLLVVAAYLRFTGLNWGEGQWIHPDEGHMRIITSVVHIPDSLSQYFDTHQSPLNSRNQGHEYSYGTLPLFLVRLSAERLDRACDSTPDGPSAPVASAVLAATGLECGAGAFTGTRSVLVGRVLSALADLGTIVIVFLIARRLYGDAVALLATGLAALTAFSIQQAHFFTVDSMAAFFVVLTAYFAVRAGETGRWLDFGLAGLATGLSAACKVSGAFAALLVALAVAWRLLARPTSRTGRALLVLGLQLLLAGLLSMLAFRIAQPYAFEGPGLLGIRLNPEWLGRLAQIGAEQGGEIDYPSGRQWTGRVSIVYPLLNIVVWGMGLPLGVAALAAWAFVGWELFRGKWEHLVLWGWVTALFLYQATRWVKTMRYFLPLYPLLAILTAYALVHLVQTARARTRGRRWRWAALALVAVVIVGAGLWGGAVFSIYLRPHTRVAASRWVYDNVEEGATIANEHWDWGIPLRLDGRDPFNSTYIGLEMQHYDEDTPDKLARLYDWLDRADYVVTASNRLYASIPRLPARYPLTTAYYRALFAGELGFELVGDFSSYPVIGPLLFPDQENPFELMQAAYLTQAERVEVRLPAAEEAFSVYDHPRVLVFRKTPEYSRERAEKVLGGIDLTRVLHGMAPRAATQAPTALEYDAETWADQQAGGTWAEMFDRNSLLNRQPGLAAAAWWVAITVLGWLAFPLTFVALPRLRDRGYGLARVVGLLIIAYLTWLAASLRVLPNTRSTITLMVALLAFAGAGVGWRRRRALRSYVARNWRLLVMMEAGFVLLYVSWIVVRLLNPDLWHPIVGGEKPMDFAYLNAVMKSTWFPPYNPWLSGTYINYYYFGFVLVGSLIKLVGTIPSIAYNLAVPLLFALTGLGAFSVAYNLFGGHRRGALIAGGAALVLTLILGNLGVVHLIRGLLIELGGDPFPSTIPGFSDNIAMIRGLWEVIVHGARCAGRPEAWYGQPTRIIPVDPGGVAPITEFPAFTFLYADLHAHMIAFPLTLLGLGLAVNWARSRRPGWSGLLLGGLAIGALRPTNTWDYPTFLVLGIGGIALGAWQVRRRLLPSPAEVKSVLWRSALLAGLTYVLYLPYIRHYAGGQSVALWSGSRTPVGIYVWILGIALLPLLTRLLIEAGRAVARTRTTTARAAILIGLGALIIATAAAVYQGYQIALLAFPVFSVCVMLMLTVGMPASRRFLWLMVGSAVALSVAVEIVVLKGDVGRMNTVFKFYLQVWTLLTVAAGVALGWVRERSRRWAPAWRSVWWIAMAALALGGALFLPYGIHARATTRMAGGVPTTLDGMAFMVRGTVVDGDPAGEARREIALVGDSTAIRWLQDNVEGSPVILEGIGYREYLWANRVSIYTGLPTVVGWRWHQVQQRPMLPGSTVDWRREDVRVFYETTDVARAWDIIARYGVRYVYVGEYERAYYGPEGLAKFDDMAADGLLRVVYSADGVTIYETAQLPSEV